MCGIAGIFSNTLDKDSLYESICRMKKSLHHRGPDQQNFWIHPSSPLALIHTRLAILDLSDRGMQPMASYSGRYQISYNGEIYNYLSMKKRINEKDSSIKFYSNTDTEILVNYIELFGLNETLNNLNGMFAFALWDNKIKKLTLVRDRIGIKPLYYGWAGDHFVFSSELKPILCLNEFKKELNTNSIHLFLRHNYIPAPHSIFKDISKLSPGSLVEFNYSNFELSNPSTYWKIENQKIRSNENTTDYRETIRQTEIKLRQSIKSRLISNVSLGAFLSGGVDSSLIASLMKEESKNNINTYSIEFEDNSFDESKYSRQVSKILNTHHTSYRVCEIDALDIVPHLSTIYDEPFADSSQIPTAILCKLSKSDTTVCLSGDGADELFGGYNRYQWTKNIYTFFKYSNSSTRNILAKVLNGINYFLNPNLHHHTLGSFSKEIFNKIDRLSKSISQTDKKNLYKYILSHWLNPSSICNKGVESEYIPYLNLSSESNNDLYSLMREIDLITYLPENILTKIDRASMSTSLEVRVPFLDHNIVEYAINIPSNFHQRRGHRKAILKDILRKYLPNEIVNRKKMGFSVPLEKWLKGPLKDWSSDLLCKEKLDDHQIFDSTIINNNWKEFQNYSKGRAYKFWSLLMFQSWYQKHIKQES